MTAIKQPHVTVIVLNYNGWADTIECLESLCNSDYNNFNIVVADNASSDGSLDYLCIWAEGRMSCWLPPDHSMRRFSGRDQQHARSYAVYTEDNEGSPPGFRKLTSHPVGSREHPLVFLKLSKNSGYAGGNNRAIRFALAQQDTRLIWLLNNDVVVDTGALSALVRRYGELAENKNPVGMLGGKLLYYDTPQVLQGVAGRYNPYLGVSRHLGDGEKDTGQYDAPLERIDYIVGASMLVTREMIDAVGLLSEDYFLYFEELDWAVRARRKGFAIDYCWESRVYHKEGRSIGTHADFQQRSGVSDYYLLRNRLVFTRKHYPQYRLLIYGSYFYSLVKGIAFGNRDRIRTVWRIIREIMKGAL